MCTLPKHICLGIFISFWLFCSGGAHAEIFGICGPTHLPVFALHIWRAFHGEIDFTLCAGQEPVGNFLLVKRDPDERITVDDSTAVSLDDATYQKLLTLYADAFVYNLKDEVLGLDGSTWCLESLSESYSKACFWSPRYNSEERGLKGLKTLGGELWSIAATVLRDGPLY
jgi:hypothetical protein